MVDRDPGYLATDPFPLAQVVAGEVSGQSLLADAAGQLYPTCGDRPVTRCVTGPAPWDKPAPAPVPVAYAAGSAHHDLMVRLFEGKDRPAEDVIAILSRFSVDSGLY